jgi:hypothetical protein
VVYNPKAEEPLRLWLEARAYRRSRTVRLVHEGQTLARWEAAPESFSRFQSPSFHFPAGLTTLTIQSDGQDAPSGEIDAPAEGDHRPFSLLVSGLAVEAAPHGDGRTPLSVDVKAPGR